MTIKFISSGKSDKGKVRASNQDGGYIGNNLYIVADGMGGHAGGDIASALSTKSVATVDDVYKDQETAVDVLLTAMTKANEELIEKVVDYPYLAGMGTTMDSVILTEGFANIVHIGDSRVYLLREGKLTQVTKDHTFVQKLVDAGRITEEEALWHPKRNVLMKVLGDSTQAPEFDIHQIELQVGDRLLLCSDGLCGFVPEAIIEENCRIADLNEATDLLIAEAKEYGAPDNVTLILLEARPAAELADQAQGITWLGSAANEVVIEEVGSNKFLKLFNRINFLSSFRKQEEFISEKDPEFIKALDEFNGKIRNWKRRGVVLGVILTLVVGASIWGIYSFTQTRFYLGVQDGKVAIYQGIKESFAGFGFSHLYEKSTVSVEDLPVFQQDLLTRTISADSLEDAHLKLKQITESVTNG